MTRFDFLVDSYRTERLKTLSVWSQVPDARLAFRPEPRGRTPLEHIVHQCLSEDAWTHSAHHRGQLTTYLRLWGRDLYSTYGPTADTGGLAKDGARVVYRYGSVNELLDREASGGGGETLPGVGPAPPTERP